MSELKEECVKFSKTSLSPPSQELTLVLMVTVNMHELCNGVDQTEHDNGTQQHSKILEVGKVLAGLCCSNCRQVGQVGQRYPAHAKTKTAGWRWAADHAWYV